MCFESRGGCSTYDKFQTCLIFVGQTYLFAAIVSALALAGCKSGSSIDREAAQKVSDSFMAYLVADRVRDAVSEMEPEMFQSATHEQVEAQIRKLFDYCGRPLDSELKHDEIGFKAYATGTRTPCESLTTLLRRRSIRRVSVFFPLKLRLFRMD